MTTSTHRIPVRADEYANVSDGSVPQLPAAADHPLGFAANERRKLERKKDALLLQKDVLLEELEHRIANSLQIIASIILIKARTVKSEETRPYLGFCAATSSIRRGRNILNVVSSNLRIIVQNDTQQRAVDLQVAIVIDEAQFPEFVHEMAHARTRRADHFSECLLADFRDDSLGFSLLAKIGQYQESPCQALLARIEQLIHKVRFDADGSVEKMCDEHLGERRLVMQHADQCSLLNSHNLAVCHCAGRCHAQRLTGEGTFAAEFVRPQYRHHSLLAVLGYDAELDVAGDDVEDGVSLIAL